MSTDSCLSSPFDPAASSDAYKSATIALAVIAGIAIVIIILLVVYIVKRLSTNGLYIVLTDIRLRTVVIKNFTRLRDKTLNLILHKLSEA